MRKDSISMGAFLLFLVSLPLLSIGTFDERSSLWILGLVFASIGGLIPPGLRFVRNGDDDDGANGEQTNGDHPRNAHDHETPRAGSDDGTREATGSYGDRSGGPRAAYTPGCRLAPVISR